MKSPIEGMKSPILVFEFRLNDPEQIVKTSEFTMTYMKNKTSLCQVPPIDTSPDNILYTTASDGAAGRLCETGEFIGELQVFQEKVIQKLTSPSGLLIRGITHKLINALLHEKSFKATQFQIDYLHLGAKDITFIEVGISKDKQNPFSAIGNKLKQCLKDTIPQALMIMYSLYVGQHPNQQFNRTEFLQLVEGHLKVLIFIPDVSKDQLQDYLERVANKKSQNAELKELLRISKNLLKFLLVYVEDGPVPSTSRLVQITSNGKRFDTEISDISLDKIFQFGGEEEKSSYYTSLLSTVSLNFFPKWTKGEALDLDERYQPSLAHWSEKHPEYKDFTCFKICLSPQQFEIL